MQPTDSAPSADKAPTLLQTLAALPPEEREAYWYDNVYQAGAKQLTIRAVIMGMALGGIMSLSNLYAGLKTGWTFGVTITAGILAYALFKALERWLPGGEFTELENNAMQSASSAAGFMVSAGLITAIPALMLMNLPAIPPMQLALWMCGISLLGVLVAVPLKRQMINVDQLPFPSGIAAAETIKSLHGHGDEATKKAKALGIAAIIGALVAWFRDANGAVVGKLAESAAWAKNMAVSLPAQLPIFPDVKGIPAGKLTLAFDISLLLYAAGAIVGLRTAISVLMGSCITWFFIAPWLIQNQIMNNNKIITGGYGPVAGWTAWPGSGMMVVAALLAMAFQWRSMARGITQLVNVVRGGGAPADSRSAEAEVPVTWVVFGLIGVTIAVIALQFFIFGINPLIGLMAVVMAMILSVMTARVTGETDIAPSVGKISQIVNASVTQGQPVMNLMTANVTAGASMHAADLLTDLKCGYLLGAKPRHQFIAQLFGVIAGTLVCVPAFYLLVPNKSVIGEKFPAPGAITSQATAEAMSRGLSAIPPTALQFTAFAIIVAVALTMLDHFFPKSRRFTPSAIGLGLGMVQPFYNAFSIFLGAVIAVIITRAAKDKAERYLVPVASGLIAGESIMAVVIIGMLLALGLA